jgi:hypothetical protein
MSDLEHCSVCNKGLKPWDDIVSVNRWDVSSGLSHKRCDAEFIAAQARRKNKPESWLAKFVRAISI